MTCFLMDGWHYTHVIPVRELQVREFAAAAPEAVQVTVENRVRGLQALMNHTILRLACAGVCASLGVYDPPSLPFSPPSLLFCSTACAHSLRLTSVSFTVLVVAYVPLDDTGPLSALTSVLVLLESSGSPASHARKYEPGRRHKRSRLVLKITYLCFRVWGT